MGQHQNHTVGIADGLQRALGDPCAGGFQAFRLFLGAIVGQNRIVLGQEPFGHGQTHEPGTQESNWAF